MSVNWSKSNHDWNNICIVANSVVSNRQARLATQAYVKRHLGVTLSNAESRSLPGERFSKCRSPRPFSERPTERGRRG